MPRTDALSVATPAARGASANRERDETLGLRLAADISQDKRQLESAPLAGRYVLKPQAAQHAHLPENECLATRLAELAGVEIPAGGLVRMPDQTLAWCVRRVGAPADGGEFVLEDFRRLAAKLFERAPGDSAELCADIARQYASEPLVALLKLYRQVVVSWWTGNNGLRLEDLAFLTGPDGVRRLAPARDLVCTHLLDPAGQLALPVGGKRDRLSRADWIRFGDACGLRPRIVERVLGRIVSSFDDALGLVERSFLGDDAKGAFAELLGRRTAMLERR